LAISDNSWSWGRRQAQRVAIDKSRIPKLTRPFALQIEGFYGFRAGRSPVKCPYVLDTPDWAAWMSGWREGLERYRGN
jgi:ribosome modulation factor